MTGFRDVQVDPYFGGFVLETLTIGMYEETRNAIREYVQNGFDSIQRAVTKLHQLDPNEGLIRIIFDIDGDGVRIRDNGAGLSAQIAVRTLTSIGASAKDFSTDAGFRGIGRLAGVAFCDTLTFTTKAISEPILTEVIFDAKKMREMMSPEHGSKYSALQLLKDCVVGRQSDISPDEPPFFEVSMRSFAEPPTELTSPEQMELFIAQISPVGYREDFAFASAIQKYAQTAPVPIDTVKIVIEETNEEPKPILKPYGAKYEIQDAEAKVTLSDIKFYTSPTAQWWAWVAKKDAPGSYTEEEVRGIRVRTKNLQIDGTALVREIFQRQNKSNGRYQDWFIGEIFVDPKRVVPNARRDGFEDNKAWRAIRNEIGGTVCKDAGTWAQEVSNQGQLTLEKLTQKTERIADEFETLRRSEFKDGDRTIGVSAAMTKLQTEVGRAARNANAATLSSLQALGSKLLDMKAEAMGKLAPGTPKIDSDRIENEARDVLLGELMAQFEQHLELPCLASVRTVVKREFGWPRS
ncbi:ATP-binding protein [Mesorhizobium sp. M7A.F.Ca.US.010.02.1.1]|uniref:ATP-binding protein n=1 Tax=Mesorhizobium sp. M7A.F.Ca.US.010.02.1.1 TaxID=2496743 RepID=UPI0013E3285E|nr:ATP-binding protein [Mesorhizobium sp. M7A.F.Ca.US.010.02.1.1]